MHQKWHEHSSAQRLFGTFRLRDLIFAFKRSRSDGTCMKKLCVHQDQRRCRRLGSSSFVEPSNRLFTTLPRVIQVEAIRAKLFAALSRNFPAKLAQQDPEESLRIE
jgi:hypothetical protein